MRAQSSMSMLLLPNHGTYMKRVPVLHLARPPTTRREPLRACIHQASIRPRSCSAGYRERRDSGRGFGYLESWESRVQGEGESIELVIAEEVYLERGTAEKRVKMRILRSIRDWTQKSQRMSQGNCQGRPRRRVSHEEAWATMVRASQCDDRR